MVSLCVCVRMGGGGVQGCDWYIFCHCSCVFSYFYHLIFLIRVLK